MELHKHRAGIGFWAGKRRGVGAGFRRLICLALGLSLLGISTGQAREASYWIGDTSVWNWAYNWSITGTPGGGVYYDGTAWVNDGTAPYFSNTGVTTIDISPSVGVADMTFVEGANAYTLNIVPRTELTFTTGIRNLSGVTQTFNTSMDLFAKSSFKFLNDATAGVGTVFNMVGGVMRQSGGARAEYWGTSNAGSATINQFGGQVFNSVGGGTVFWESSSAASSTINNYGSDVAGGRGGYVSFWDTSTAGNSTITLYGGTMEGAGGGSMALDTSASAGTSTVTAMGGTNGGDGSTIVFLDNAEAGQATIKIYGNATLDVSNDYYENSPLLTTTFSLGSLEGDGTVYIGERTLSVGGLNRSTTFAGVINDLDLSRDRMFDGNLTKVGTGTFTLTGANAYSGQTKVNGGTLLIGTGGSIISAVTVNSGGTFGGDGTVLNSVTVNSGGNLAPGGEAITKVSGAGMLKTGAKASFTLDGPGTPDGARLTTAGTDYGQVQLGGALTIQSGVDLVVDATGLAVNSDFVVGEANVLSENYFIFNLTAAGSTLSQTGVFVTGAFASLNGQAISYENGFGLVSVGGRFYSISYQGDYATNSTIGGNDVVLSAVTVPEPGTCFLMLGGLGLLALGRGRKKVVRLGRAAGFCLGAFLIVMGAGPAVAANSTWNGASSAWTDSGNWIGGQPGGEVVEVGGSWVATGRSAVFSDTGVTTVDVVGSSTYDVAVDGITFDGGANAYALNLNARTQLTVTGGIINNSGVTQTINTFTDFNASSKLKFLNDATAGNDTVFNMVGGVMRLGWGSDLTFWGHSSAAGATINQFGGNGYLANGGGTFFRESSSAGSSTFNNYGTDVMGGGGGTVKFWDNATAGNSTITNYGGTMEGAGGGSVSFWDDTSAGTSTLIALGGTDGGGGGVIEFIGNADASQATIKLYGNSTLEVSDAWGYHLPRTGTIQVGSLEGEGAVYIGQRTLSVGSLNTSTTFAGAIVDPDPWEEQEFDGNLTKTGTGTFTLTGTSTYSGKTTVNGGTLLIGTGGSIISAVTVNSGGTFGGDGTVLNSVTVNSGGNLAPGGEAITKVSGAGMLKTGAKASFTLDGPGTADGARLTTAGTDYGQVQLDGALTIQSGVDLVIDATGLAVNSDFVVGEANVLSENYFIFNLTAAGSTLSQTGVFVTGAFASLNGQAISYENGFGLVSVGGRFYSISYQGDYATNSTIGGNDVVLSAVTVPEPGTFVLILGGLVWFVVLHRRGSMKRSRSHFSQS